MEKETKSAEDSSPQYQIYTPTIFYRTGGGSSTAPNIVIYIVILVKSAVTSNT